MDSKLGFLFYVGVKFVAYASWCALGLHVLGHQKPRVGKALGTGLVRLLIGVFFGVGIFLVGGMMHLDVPLHPWRLYFGIYAPVRWIEWSIMAVVLAGSNIHENFLLGSNNASRLWRLGGIVVSHLADIPLILSAGRVTEMLPVGRFLC